MNNRLEIKRHSTSGNAYFAVERDSFFIKNLNLNLPVSRNNYY